MVDHWGGAHPPWCLALRVGRVVDKPMLGLSSQVLRKKMRDKSLDIANEVRQSAAEERLFSL